MGWITEPDGSVLLLLHPVLPLLFACVSVLTCLGCVLVVNLPPGPVSADGTRLIFISAAIRNHCGISTIVLGCSAHLAALGQYVVCAHIGRQDAAIYVLLELIGWYIVLAYQATGLAVHMLGLALFLVGSQLMHLLTCRHPLYKGVLYQHLNLLTLLLSVMFGTALPLSEFLPDQKAQLFSTNLGVSLEYVLLCTFAAQNLCMAHGLNRLRSIHLVFEAM